MTFAELDMRLYSQTPTETAALQMLPQTQRYLTLLRQSETGIPLTAEDVEFAETFRGSPAWLEYELDARSFTSTQVLFESQKGVFHIAQQERYRVEPMHRHRFFELFVVYAGSCEVTVNGETMTLHQGDVCLLSLHTSHRIAPLSAGDIVLNFRMMQELLSSEKMEKTVGDNPLMDQFYFARARGKTVPPYIRISCAARDHFMSIIRLMACEYFESDVLSFPTLVGYFAPFFSELARAWMCGIGQPIKAEPQTDKYQQALNYIKRFYRVCTVENTAERVGYSPTYLSALIRKSTGRSFSELRRYYRLEAAADLLLDTSESIGEIASRVGYSNLTYFYRAFREQYGVTPQEYRKHGGK